MRKILILIVTIVATISLSACSDDIELLNDNDLLDVSVEEMYDQKNIDEDYGSLGALASLDFTIEEMLVYALQDEYTARGEYIYIMDTFDVTKPFSNIKKSEETHIELLLPMFELYQVTLIEDTSSEHLYEINTLQEAYEIGVLAEINNIAMYNLFLDQDDLPSDLADVFTKLRDASENHLAAFQKHVS